MIAIVIPTIRPEHLEKFKDTWKVLFEKHGCELVVVQDGDNPTVNGKSAEEIMGKYASVLTNFNSGIRNLGFAYVARVLRDCEIIITLDDDVTPIGDTIQDHIDALQKRVPVSWISTASEYTRGFPYSIRNEAEVVISHGVWEGSGDWDAPTQLVLGEKRPATFYKGPIPKGIYYPMCSMNLAFKRKVLPYIFHAPWVFGIHRFDDIFAGIVSKREIDKLGWAVISGYAAVNHDKASNPFQNLKNEAAGIELNENFWKGDESHPYFEDYRNKYKLWQEFIGEIEKQAKEVVKQGNEVENQVEENENQGELNFWRRWLADNGKYFEKPRRLGDRFTFMIGDKKEATIANLGAGPMNLIGDDRRDVKVKVVSSDTLADEYAKMRKEFDINPENPVEKQDMENLTYEDNSFDIVYCANALDHSQDPYKALREMLRVCKSGGYVYLRHIAHEGKRHLYRGLHKWNIDVAEGGDCKIWSNKPGLQENDFLLSAIYPGFTTTEELLPKAVLITSFVQKK